MKKLRLILLILLTTAMAKAQIKPDVLWLDSKYSMFIHFGLYSKLGGVWNGEPVRQGYSEQIQSFAGIFSDWYGYTAYTFNPEKWDADSIVALAKKAGMRSIVFTSKHHDGFCMYDSKYTDYNIVDMTPYGKDIMKELSDACRRGGIRFAVYFSLIDWHYPQAYPISSHNADPLTDEHFQYNMNQVEEIMTNYGKISEIWFDMGSLTPEQSAGLYALVNRLQPSCMISGRLGNNAADFSVLADNEYPDYKIGVPWQTAASMFDETWGYRSWQERGKVGDKVREKLRSLIKVVSRGGNYLLNIGPDGDGAVVPFERDVLLSMGEWISRYAEAIYATRSNPFDDISTKYDVTCKDKAIYLFLYDIPENNTISLNGLEGKVEYVELMQNKDSKVKYSMRKGNLSIMLPDTFRLDSVASVVKIAFDEPFGIKHKGIITSGQMDQGNATMYFGYSALDYYCGFKSLIGYRWIYSKRASSAEPHITFTDNELGRKAVFSIDGKETEIEFKPTNKRVEYADLTAVKWGKAYTMRGSGIFGNVPFEGKTIKPEDADSNWAPVDGYKPGRIINKFALPFMSEYMLVEVNAGRDLDFPVKIVAGNSAYVLLNGKYISAEFSDQRPERSEKLLVLPLKRGKNQILIKTYNRYAKNITIGLVPQDEWNVYTLNCEKVNLGVEREHNIEIHAADRISRMVPMSLENIEIDL